MKHLLKLLDLSGQEIIDILNLADQLKYEQKHGIEHKLLKGKTLGMIFQKASTRTRVSFEVGMYQLGGMPLFLSAKPDVKVVYEDENILLADKKPGVLCHKGQVGAVISAVTHRHLHQPPGRGAADRGQSVPQAAQRGDQGIGIGLQRVQRDQQRRIGGHCFHHAEQLRRLHSGIQRHNLRVHLFTDLTAADGQHAAVPHGGKLDHNKNPLCVRYFGAGQEVCGVALG